jgi:ankyrin repeat protein
MQKGINITDKTSGELMLEAASLGLINVIKAFESNMYRLDFTNAFGEGLLHYAAKGNQERMVHYLLLRKIDPNV